MTGGARGSVSAPPARSLVLRALEAVRDPELDEPVTSLGFVSSCTVSGDGSAEVHLRLPTYFCAPNFAYLMVADAYDAIRAVPGVERVVVELDDHFAATEINAGVAAQAGFVGTFGDQADGELDELRSDFLRRAVFAGTDRVARPLLTSGTTPEQLAELTLGELPGTADLERLKARRRELGLPAADDAHLLIDVTTGARLASDDPAALRMHLGRARLSRVNIEANSGVCRGMLASRYGLPTEVEEVMP